MQNTESDNGLGRIVISQTLLFEENKYKCWFVDDIHLGKEHICYSETKDGISSWTDKKIVKLSGLDITPWHLHILKDGIVYWLVVYDHRKITLWKSERETEFEYVKTLIEPSGAYGSFYSNNTYRACLTKIGNEKYRLYFSADDYFRSYIGVMEGESPESMTIISVDNKKHYSLPVSIYLFLRTKYCIHSKKASYYSKRLCQKLIEMIKFKLK